MRTVVILAASAALAACSSTPAERPTPPAITLYQCAAPAGMTAPERQPLRPVGNYTQEDVALYITELHQWATRGWLKVARVREHADKCVASNDEDDED